MSTGVLGFILGLLIGLVANILIAIKKNDKNMLCKAIVLHTVTIVLALFFEFLPDVCDFMTNFLGNTISFLYETVKLNL